MSAKSNEIAEAIDRLTAAVNRVVEVQIAEIRFNLYKNPRTTSDLLKELERIEGNIVND